MPGCSYDMENGFCWNHEITDYLPAVPVPVAVECGPRWEQMEGVASSIGVGPDRSVWITTGDPSVTGLGNIRVKHQGYGYWDKTTDGTAFAIDVGMSNIPWCIHTDGNLF